MFNGETLDMDESVPTLRRWTEKGIPRGRRFRFDIARSWKVSSGTTVPVHDEILVEGQEQWSQANGNEHEGHGSNDDHEDHDEHAVPLHVDVVAHVHWVATTRGWPSQLQNGHGEWTTLPRAVGTTLAPLYSILALCCCSSNPISWSIWLSQSIALVDPSPQSTGLGFARPCEPVSSYLIRF